MNMMKDSRRLELALLRAKTDRQLMAVIEHQLEFARRALTGSHPGGAEQATRCCLLAQRLMALLRVGTPAGQTPPLIADPTYPQCRDSATHSLRT
jgi:hypothetical protein